jgi:PAS domain S-box-containing protein
MAKIRSEGLKEVVLSVPILSLLQKAQERFLERSGSETTKLSSATARTAAALTTDSLVHELQVHEIELEMQNEELASSQLALSESREEYFDLYDLAPVGYITVSDKGTILRANLTVASMLCRTRSTLIKKQFTRLIHKNDQDRFYLCNRALLDIPKGQSCELRMRKADDTYFWAQAVLTLSKDRHGIAEHRIILTDITLRKQADEERTVLLKQLQNKNTELEAAYTTVARANLTQANFISNVTHDLRTPLNAIIGFSQLLNSGQPSPTLSQKHRIDQISTAGWELLDMVDKIIALTKDDSENPPKDDSP